MAEYHQDYLLDKKVKMYQKKDGYKTSSDAVLIASLIDNLADDAKILDVGSGSGGISLCLAYRFPKAQIKGLELQPDLVELSNLSAKENRLSNLQYICHNIKNRQMPLPINSFDCVITNPPYEKNGTKSPNESKALAHNQELSLEEWLKFCLKALKPYGFLYLIHRAEALEEILSILQSKTGNICIVPVYSRAQQTAKRVMIMAQKTSKAPLKILPPLVVHTENGHTEAAQKILRDGMSFFKSTD